MRFAAALAAVLLMATPAAAETEAERIASLDAQLEAQMRANDLLKQRIETLEAQLAGRVIPPPARGAAPLPADPGRAPEDARALERALERRGTAVLPSGVWEVTPGVAWTHSGSDALGSDSDSYAASLDARVGLPGGWMLGAGVPLRHRDTDDGRNTGIGDASATVWKELVPPGRTGPSVVASLGYRAPTGEDFSEDDVPLGSGFHQLSGGLSAVETIDPVALFGSVSYTHAFEEDFDGTRIDPDGAIGVGAGASLAVTPEITVSTGVSFSFSDGFEVDGRDVPGSDTTLGQVELGAGFLLTRDVFLSLSGAFGVTDDSPDVSVGASLPIRF